MAENKIRVLPVEIVNKISAGEVVERPASVVKELVENSVDAGAERITVEIRKGGSELIKTADDGCGMSDEDALLCMERHSTSKLETAGDIGRVTTLGFRGEALPSIASVSRMSIKTRSEDYETGIVVHAEGGRIKRREKTAAPPGTEVNVRDLFFNTPARRKFLKSVSTELAHISNIVTSQALSRADIHFELIHNGKFLLRAPRADKLRDRLLALFGAEAARHLIPFEKEREGAVAGGMLSNPEYSRTQNNCMFFFVNGRAVKSRLLHHAVLQAYRPLIPADRFPFICLFISVDPGLVDVNIHPRKTELKFLSPGKIHDFIENAVRDALNTPDSLPSMLKENGNSASRAAIFEAVGKYASEKKHSEHVFDFTPGYKHSPGEPGAASGGKTPLQAGLSYIITEDAEGIIIIDQHAAHEKILYEKLRSQHEKGLIPVQHLLSPCTVEPGAAESALLRENLGQLKKAGFEAEDFGPNAFILRTVPAALEKAEPGRLFLDMASDLLETGQPAELEKIINRILCSAACHAAVKAGDRLEVEEMSWIVSALGKLNSPYSCPHGRPSMIRLEFNELARRFKRTKL